MHIIIGCERSGIVRQAFRKRGHDAWSCDLEPAEDSSVYHIQNDILEVLARQEQWDLGLFYPECTYLCSSGLHWNKRKPERAAKTEEALAFVMSLQLSASVRCDKWCIENSIGCLSTRWRKPDQIIQPYQFGHDASKSTALWLHDLSQLTGTQYVQPRWVCKNCGVSRPKPGWYESNPICIACGSPLLPRWANQTDSGQNKLGPSATRSMDRARTYQGIANAMSSQWSNLSPL